MELYKNSPVSGFVEIIDYLGSDGLTPVNAARASYGKQTQEFTEKDKKLIKYCMREKHTSIFEHNTVTFAFKVPLFVARQHMRHRTWSFNEISRRYTSVNIEFYQPNLFRTQHKKNHQASNLNDLIDPPINTVTGEISTYTNSASDLLLKHTERSLYLYNNFIDAGICREQARMLLPQNLYTTYWGTVNLNNLIKFIELRDHEGAQEEIQQVAKACKELVTEIWPNIMGIYEEVKNGK